MRDDAPIDAYLRRVLAAARLAPGDAQAVRAELREHLGDLLHDHPSVLPSEVPAMLEREFGNPEQLGQTIARSKGRWRTLLKTRGRRLAVRLAVGIVLLASVRWTVAEVFYVPSGSLAPVLPRGSRCLVYKLADTFRPGDVIVYRQGSNCYVGSVSAVDAGGAALTVERNAQPHIGVPLGDVVGKVVLNTR